MREASQYKYSDVLHHLINLYVYIFRVRWQRWGDCHRIMFQIQLVLGVISFLSIGRGCFRRAHKLADGFSVTRLEMPSLVMVSRWAKLVYTIHAG